MRSILLLLPWVSLVWGACLAAPGFARAGLPPGFSKTLVQGTFDQPTGVSFDENGRMYVWERAGRVWIVEDEVKLATPLVDISDEVGSWAEHGLLGFALHPNFLENGWIYLFYAVDHYHLLNASSPSYDPNRSEPDNPSQARITRYTARAADGFHSVDPASRRVLLGETPGTGCPLLHESHGAGALAFGTDGTLLASCGDGGSFVGPDTGGDAWGAYAPQAIAEGIITLAEDVGAFRAQLPSSLAGKILRIDARTGDGVPGNPYFEAAAPRSARSRVYALGFRNPFRFAVRPDTGSHDPSAGSPGSLYVANVGWNAWEEIEAVTGPGYNSGWPIFEGFNPSPEYPAIRVANLDAPNPLYDGAGGSCPTPFFAFNDLIVQDTLGTPSFPNPCNPAVQIPDTIPRYVHDRAGLIYGHSVSGPLFTPIFTGTTPAVIRVGAPGSPVAGEEFGGFAPTGGVWYTGTDFPAAYQNSFFLAEYAEPRIVQIRYDTSDRPVSVATFDDAPGGVVSLATSPTTGGLYAVDLSQDQVYRIRYQSGADQPPVAQASVEPGWGPTPLGVRFSASGSSDPEGQALAYSWSFGDGTPPSTLADPIHFYFGPVGVPTIYTATLVVRDPLNQTSTAQVKIYVNNSPPAIAITSPTSQGLYPMSGPTSYPLNAAISDPDHPLNQLSCAWQTTLHHNAHAHPEPVVASCSASAVVEPLGCDGNDYWVTFALTVTDPTGLATTREVGLYPDCASTLPPICGNLDASLFRNFSDLTRMRAGLSNPGVGFSAGELSRCSVIGGVECDVVDMVVLRRYLSGRAPGPMPVCPAALP